MQMSSAVEVAATVPVAVADPSDSNAAEHDSPDFGVIASRSQAQASVGWLDNGAHNNHDNLGNLGNHQASPVSRRASSAINH
jgi:hypothetical protein